MDYICVFRWAKTETQETFKFEMEIGKLSVVEVKYTASVE